MRNKASWRCTARGRAAMARATMAAISSHCATSSREASGTTQVATARNTGEESVIAENVDVAPQAGNKPPRPLPDRASPLLFQQRALTRDAPAVAAEAAARSHDPVARDNERRGVRGTSARNGARGGGLADRTRDLGVGAGGAIGDAAQRFPYAPLERRGAHVQRQVERLGTPVQVAQQRPDGRGKRATIPAQLGGGELGGEPRLELFRAAAEADAADPARRRRHEQPAEC